MILKTAKEVLKIEAEAVRNLIPKLNESFEDAVKLILSCKGRVVVTGIGKSGIIGKKIVATLSSTGTPSLFLHPTEGSHGDLGMITKSDIVIAISNSGETEEINNLLSFFKKKKIKIISMTGKTNSTLARHSNFVLDTGVKREACPLGLAPTASTTAMLAMGDALAIALLKERDFKREDYALLHPAGSLGRRLSLKVKDVMKIGKQIPIVKHDITMKEAVAEISIKKFGFALVLDANKKLKGIITDGDVRRSVKVKDFLNKRVDTFMSKKPKIIDKDSLAVEALEKMEKYSITSLSIVNKKNIPEGVVHLHDLLGRTKFRF